VRAYRVAYDGTGFSGFQRQPDVGTVEGTLFGALARLGVYDRADHRPAGYAAAGRTDAGVSALAQTITLDAPDWLTPRALNSELPPDVRTWASADPSQPFHATHDAVDRSYTYHLHAPDADPSRAREALAALAGRHDFHNLTPDESGTERSLSTRLDVEGEFLVLTVTADGFPRGLVRRLASLVDAVGRGDRDPAFVDRVLSSEPVSGGEGVASAPAAPLVLADVRYDDVSFVVDEEAASSARAVFEARRVERTTGARVAAQLRDGP
jgi:tRNA pseudouridine38-40 synthase